MNSLFRRAEARTLLILALPVFLAQIAQSSMGFVDTVVAGRAGDVDMAGVALASSFWMPSTLFGQGLLMAMTPLVAQSLGAGQREGIGGFFRQGLWMALGIAVLLMLVLFGVSCGLAVTDKMEKSLALMASGYLRAVVWGLPGLMLYIVCRCFLDGHGKTRPAMIAGFIGLACNIPLNFIFVFGLLGMPALGGVGCGLATAVVCWIMALVMFLSVRKENRKVIRFEAVDGKRIGRVLRIGLPGAFALLVETSIFSIIAVLIAPMGAVVVAGHQVALNVSGLVFMIPLSLGTATTIRIGTCLGEGDPARARLVRRTALCLGLVLACCTAACLLAFRYPIARIYTDSASIISLGALLLVYDALYQISDATQVLTLAALRGYNDTRAIFCVTFVAYWLIALPLGYILSLTSLLGAKPMGVAGFWISIIVGLSIAAALFLWRIARLERLPLGEVRARLNR